MDDSFNTRVLDELAGTPYACTSLDGFSTRPGNHVFRGHLAKTMVFSNGRVAESIIIKRTALSAAEVERQMFDECFAKAIGSMEAPDYAKGIVIRAPKIYEFNQYSDMHLQEDFTGTGSFIFMLIGPRPGELFDQVGARNVGFYLGTWLRDFHAWADDAAQAGLRAQLPRDDPMRRVKCRFTFDNFLGVLEESPQIMEGYERTLIDIRDAMVAEFGEERDEDGWGIVHGDLWGGNILVPNSGWKATPSTEDPNELFVIDWEMAQFGHRSYDLGQILGDLYERKVYKDRDVVMAVMDAVMRGYGAVTKEMAFRTAIYVGVHLITWQQRRPKTGPAANVPQEVVERGLRMGRDFLVKGWEKDTQFLMGTELAPLFSKER